MRKILIMVTLGLLFGGLPINSAIGASGDQPVNINSVNTSATFTVTIANIPAVTQSGVWSINATITNTPSVTQSGDWQVSILGTPSIRYLSYESDSMKIYGDLNVPFKQDSSGQIYAITAPEAGTNIKKTYEFSNIASGSWVEVGSYTVTTGKSLKIYTGKATGLFGINFKISNGTAEQDLRLATTPSMGADQITEQRPIANAGGTVIRCYAKAETATNEGTISFNGFEY